MFYTNSNSFILTISVFVLNQLSLNCVKCPSVENFDVFKPYSDEEIECFSKAKFFYNGSCEFLNSRASCAEGETLILNEDNAERMEPICKMEKCLKDDDTSYFWWPSEKRCISRYEIQTKYCSNSNSKLNKKLSIDNFGNGQCRCFPVRGSFEGSDDCYKLYRERGPCRIDQVVTYDESTGHAVCSEDLCFDLNHPPESDSEEKLYGPLRGTGPCYKFGRLDMCESKMYIVAPEEPKVPDCKLKHNPWTIINGAPLCKVDTTTGKCREEVELNTNDDRKNKPYAKSFLCRTLRDIGTGKSKLKGCFNRE